MPWTSRDRNRDRNRSARISCSPQVVSGRARSDLSVSFPFSTASLVAAKLCRAGSSLSACRRSGAVVVTESCSAGAGTGGEHSRHWTLLPASSRALIKHQPGLPVGFWEASCGLLLVAPIISGSAQSSWRVGVLGGSWLWAWVSGCLSIFTCPCPAREPCPCCHWNVMPSTPGFG